MLQKRLPLSVATLDKATFPDPPRHAGAATALANCIRLRTDVYPRICRIQLKP